jgi:two-component system response regulator MtrA
MSYRRSKRDRVLVVDDDASLAEMLTIVLEAEGLTTTVCRSGDEVMAAFGAFKPDVVLLDLMLPGLDGMKVCRQIRATSTKPFKNTELVARVRARLRRTDAVGDALEFGDIVLDPAAHTVSRKGRALDLTPLEFDLLACLLSSPEQVFTREVLLERVWGYHHPGDTKLVNVHMTRLRSKIEDDAEAPEVIRTVRGVGYQAIAPEPAS